MADTDGSVIWYNRGWYDYTGTDFESMQGWGWRSVHDPNALPMVIEHWKHSLTTGESFEMEFPVRGADGAFRWFLTRANPLRNEQGSVIRWFGTSTDVNEVKRVERELRDQKHNLELLIRTGNVVSSTIETDALLQAVTDIATELSGTAIWGLLL